MTRPLRIALVTWFGLLGLASAISAIAAIPSLAAAAVNWRSEPEDLYLLALEIPVDVLIGAFWLLAARNLLRPLPSSLTAWGKVHVAAVVTAGLLIFGAGVVQSVDTLFFVFVGSVWTVSAFGYAQLLRVSRPLANEEL